MNLKLSFYGMIAETLGNEFLEVMSFHGHTINDLIDWLEGENPKLAEYSYSVAMNRTLVQKDVELINGAEIALLPPFAGG